MNNNNNTFFTTPALEQSLQSCLQLITDDAPLVVLAGVRHSGKKTFTRQLLSIAPISWRMHCKDAQELDDPRTVLEHLFAMFVPDNSIKVNAPDADALGALFGADRLAGYRPVLLVNNAHQLGAHTLLILTSLTTPEDPRNSLHLILSGDLKISEQLNQTRPGHAAFPVVNLPKFTETEASDYLAHRARCADVSHHYRFTRSHVANIFRQSGGLPGLINQGADRLQRTMDGLNTESDNATPVATADRSQRWLLAPLSIAALTLAFFGFNQLSVGKPQATVDQIPAEVVAVPTIPVENLVLTQPDEAEVALEVETVTVAEEPMTVDSTPNQLVSEIDANKVYARPHAAKTPVLLNNIQWLSDRNPAHYTMQLFGAHDRDRVTTVASEMSATPGRTVVLETDYRGREWHILIWNSFENRDAALAAKSELPQSVKDLKPWPKPFSSLQTQMVTVVSD